jgi:hypothetical protein
MPGISTIGGGGGVAALGGLGEQLLQFLQGLPGQVSQWQQIQQQQQAQATTGLQQLAQIGAAIPTISSNPQYMQSVARYLRSLRIDPNLVIQNGQVNVAAIGGQSQAAKLLGDPSFMTEVTHIDPSQRQEWWNAQQLGPMPDIIAHLPYDPQTAESALRQAQQLFMQVQTGAAQPEAAIKMLAAFKSQMNPEDYQNAVDSIIQAGQSHEAMVGQQWHEAKTIQLLALAGLTGARTEGVKASTALTKARTVETQVLTAEDQYRLSHLLPAQVAHLAAQDQYIATEADKNRAQISKIVSDQIVLSHSGKPLSMNLPQYLSLSRYISQQQNYWEGKRAQYAYAIQVGEHPGQGQVGYSPQEIAQLKQLESQANKHLSNWNNQAQQLGAISSNPSKSSGKSSGSKGTQTPPFQAPAGTQPFVKGGEWWLHTSKGDVPALINGKPVPAQQ